MVDPRLYILMRTDMPSLNPGKAMAQAAHAGNMLSEHFRRLTPGDTAQEQLFAKWLGDRGFGTTIVLCKNRWSDLGRNFDPGDPTTREDLIGLIDQASSIGNVVSGIVHDPTYPVSDGAVTHLVPVDVCAWVFGDANDPRLRAVLDQYQLHP